MIKKTILSFFTLAMLLCVNVYAGGGKIVFSKSIIDAATGESLVSTASFDVGEMVYCHVYLPKAIGKYKESYGTHQPCSYWSAVVYIDDIERPHYSVNNESFKNEEESTTTNFGFILCDGKTKSESDYGSDSKAFKKAINDLKPGPHKIRVEIWIDDKRAKGEFTLNKTENAKLKLGVSFNDVKAKMTDVPLEDKIMKFLKEEQQSGSGFYSTTTYLKLKIIIPEWEIRNHPSSGVIIGRSLDIALVYKTKNGDCEIGQFCVFQSYNGKGYQETLQALPLNQNFNSHKEVKQGPCDCE